MSGFVGGGVGRPGQSGRQRTAAGGAGDFSLTATSVMTLWDSVTVGELLPADALPGRIFVLVGEPAGLAVVNG